MTLVAVVVSDPDAASNRLAEGSGLTDVNVR